jgi:hypothetical protein
MPASIISCTRCATRSGPPQTSAKSVTSSGICAHSSSAFSLLTMLTLTSRDQLKSPSGCSYPHFSQVFDASIDAAAIAIHPLFGCRASFHAVSSSSARIVQTCALNRSFDGSRPASCARS